MTQSIFLATALFFFSALGSAQENTKLEILPKNNVSAEAWLQSLTVSTNSIWKPMCDIQFSLESFDRPAHWNPTCLDESTSSAKKKATGLNR